MFTINASYVPDTVQKCDANRDSEHDRLDKEWYSHRRWRLCACVFFRLHRLVSDILPKEYR